MSIVVDVAIAFKVSESVTKALVIDAEDLAERSSGDGLVGVLQRLKHVG
jgi:hypothetical protein